MANTSKRMPVQSRKTRTDKNTHSDIRIKRGTVVTHTSMQIKRPPHESARISPKFCVNTPAEKPSARRKSIHIGIKGLNQTVGRRIHRP